MKSRSGTRAATKPTAKVGGVLSEPTADRWLVDSARLTAFSPAFPALQLPALSLIEGSQIVQKTWNQQQQHEVEIGVLGDVPGVQIAFSRQFGRADIVISAVITDPGQSTNSIGTSKEAFLILERVSAKWLAALCPLNRVAVGATSFSPARDEAQASRSILARLPNFPRSEGLRDLTLQWNKPYESASVPGLRINRLWQWSVAQFANILLAPNQGAVASQGVRAAILGVDVNTNAEGYDIKKEMIAGVYKEIIQAALEMLDGDGGP